MLTPEDYRLRRLLAPISKELRSVVSRLDEIRTQQASSSRNQEQATSEAASRTVAALVNLQTVPTNKETAQPGQQHQGPSPWLSFSIQAALCFFTALAFFAAAWYACIAHQQLITSGKQLSTMQKQLETTDRPWLDVGVSMARQLTLDKNGIRVDVLYMLTNFGRSPA